MPGAKVTDLFFDRQAVTDAVGKGRAKVLSREGAFIRQSARSSMKRRKAVSKPGKPPSAHEGSLKDKLYFSFDASAASVVTGPVRYRKGAAPRVLEEGGSADIVSHGQTRTVNIEARPYMGPALEKEIAEGNIPSRWEGEVHT